ncbi:MAG: hypothetical protein WCL27_10455 [Betaproteobacteria bacterium]
MNPATLKSAVCLALTLLLTTVIFAPLPARAIDTAPENPDTAKPFASTWQIKGDITVTGLNGETRQLKKGSTVYIGEKVVAASDGEAVLQTADAGVVAIRPGAAFIPERFAAEGKKTDHQVLRLITGSLRLISGWIGKLNGNEHRVLTPTATIGIRGTDHEPYVLPPELTSQTYQQGTYDKVNRGETLLDANGGNVAIESGKVGFARDPNSVETKTRALMTLLLPTILSKVPDFYVPGAFDKELDHYSANADSIAQTRLEKITGRSKTEAAAKPTTVTPVLAAANKPAVQPALPPIVGCPPETIGERWLGRLDLAIADRDVKTILGLFAPEITAKATVQQRNGPVTLEFNRNEMVESTLNSMSNLKNYQQRRVSLQATLAEGETAKTCKQLNVSSITIEQGLMNDKPFRVESLEEYLLEQRNGEWLAIKVHTTQR